MIGNQNIPKLRFPGFDGEWEKKKLGDVGKIKMCKRIFSNETSESGDIPFYKIGTFGREADAYITKELYLDYKSRFSFPKIGEILMSASGTLGRTVVYDGKPAYFQDSNIVWIENNEEVITNSFLFYIYQIVRYDSEGGTIQRLYNSIISNTKFNRPTLPEQQKIASFLSAVDEKIQQLSRKKELLEQYKKGVMQQLFSGKLRFKDENGNKYPDWEEKKLGEVLKIGSGKDYKHLDAGNIPVFGTGGYMLSVNKFLHSGETVFIGRKGTIDKPFYFEGDFWTVDTLFYTHTFKNTIPKFIYCVFQQIDWKLHNEASGVPSLSKSTIEKLKFDFPCIEEQQKIANFLSSIDAKIENTNGELEKIQLFKKGLLQQLFV